LSSCSVLFAEYFELKITHTHTQNVIRGTWPIRLLSIYYYILPLLKVSVHVRELDVHNITQLSLGEVSNANGSNVPINLDILVARSVIGRHESGESSLVEASGPHHLGGERRPESSGDDPGHCEGMNESFEGGD